VVWFGGRSLEEFLRRFFGEKLERELKEENGCTLEVLKEKMWLSVKNSTICSSHFFIVLCELEGRKLGRLLFF
jgi:hypothetical protein